jgi:predicted cupin superfamily sugar epimerase
VFNHSAKGYVFRGQAHLVVQPNLPNVGELSATVPLRISKRIKSLLKLVPLSIQGDYYAETYRLSDVISPECLQGRYSGSRSVNTAIYYLLEPGTFSEIHRVASDEIFHFYLGDPVEMLQLWPDGSGKRVFIGTDIESGMAPQVVVPHVLSVVATHEFFEHHLAKLGHRDLLSR